MKVLVVGSGGREHAICRAVAKSSRVDKIYCAPGNAGIAALAECVPIGAMEFDKLVSFAKDNAIDFTIIGMDDPLVGSKRQGSSASDQRRMQLFLRAQRHFQRIS